MSPPRLGPPSNTFNYFEDTLETARLHITQADYSSRKRQSRAGTTGITRRRPVILTSVYALTAARVHPLVRRSLAQPRSSCPS